MSLILLLFLAKEFCSFGISQGKLQSCSFESSITASQLQCVSQCMQTIGCLSVNIQKLSTSQYMCELNNGVHGMDQCTFDEDSQFMFYEINI